MSDWHIRKIPKGTYGELSKIKEELEEAYDSEERGQILMLMFELSDIIGAAGGVAAKYGMKLDDLVTFSKLRSEIAIKDLELKEIAKVSENISQVAKDYKMPPMPDLVADMQKTIKELSDMHAGKTDWVYKREDCGSGGVSIYKVNRKTGKKIDDHMTLVKKEDLVVFPDYSGEEEVVFPEWKPVPKKCVEQEREEIDFASEMIERKKLALRKQTWLTKLTTAFTSWMKSLVFWKSGY